MSSEGSKVLREHPITLGRLEGVDGKALYADYVLVYRNRKLAVIEAKAWAEPACVERAERVEVLADAEGLQGGRLS